ncbi:hypothetical protein FNV43_RR12290 [Rhamnella rubrinervis]|uniref:Histone acetyltransferase n=1 Tax=Rhamnella rubrinervis TaxID=2594499 RepID=A0A8K0MIQ9_9ROSA|nr:hypothetical protein FNV43_RR12290 [Rhamnella rubrinervis]
MPRPGPRPYECVKRAWHSDRHQPIRGSLIKEIFRVANEIHSSATKKNKEWQEKLPIVVLKAEEIMYSKANSEAEYMDLKTLWDRTNDAINTIIRRDESTETGEFLQPCIEAALNLGCTPRRASRSQRNSNPRCYLSLNSPEVPSVSPSMLDNTAQGDYIISSVCMSHGSNFGKPPTTMNSTPLSCDSRNPVAQNGGNVPTSNYGQPLALENYAVSTSFTAYPLYYGKCHQFEELQRGFGAVPKSVSNPLEPSKRGVVSNLFCNKDASKTDSQGNVTGILQNPCNIGCDLSLRLGPLSLPCPSVGNGQPQDVKDGGYQEGSAFSHQSSQLDKEFPFFPRVNTYVPLGSCSSICNLEGAYMTVEEKLRKRKAAFDHPVEDQQIFWQPKLRL